MRDIQLVLERWGAWVADNREDVYWPPIAAGFSGLIPSKVKSRTQCCDEDGLIISGIMAGLNSKHPVVHSLLFDYYVFGKHLCSYRKSITALILTLAKSYRTPKGLLTAT